MSFNHFDEKGRAVMVDISAKQPTMRIAVASATITMKPETVAAIVDSSISKGDVFGVARLAGIAAAKKTPDLIPLSHPLAIHSVSVDFSVNTESGCVTVESRVKAFERTGMEMEAMVSASVAALTIYDMCKGVDRGMIISETKLLYKEGGKSGLFKREENPPGSSD